MLLPLSYVVLGFDRRLLQFRARETDTLLFVSFVALTTIASFWVLWARTLDTSMMQDDSVTIYRRFANLGSLSVTAFWMSTVDVWQISKRYRVGIVIVSLLRTVIQLYRWCRSRWQRSCRRCGGTEASAAGAHTDIRR